MKTRVMSIWNPKSKTSKFGKQFVDRISSSFILKIRAAEITPSGE
jgi:hypothetical protein